MFLGIYLPLHYYGGFGEMFRAIDAAKPGFLDVQADRPERAVVPVDGGADGARLLHVAAHAFGAVFTAADERTFRRNAMVLPLYQLILLFVFFCGFAAILKVPGLTGADIDLSLLKSVDPDLRSLVRRRDRRGGRVDGAGAGLDHPRLGRDAARQRRAAPADARRLGETVTLTARGLVPVIALVAVYFTCRAARRIVALLLMGYAFVTQLFPAVLCSLMARNPMTKQGAAAGIVVGVAAVACRHADPQHVRQPVAVPSGAKAGEVNVGFAALILNVGAAAVSLATRPAPAAAAAPSR